MPFLQYDQDTKGSSVTCKEVIHNGKPEVILALAKPRKIVVDGKEYHWKTSRNGKFHLVIVDPKDNSRKIVIQYSKNKMITPRHVRYRIKTAPKEWSGEIKVSVDND